MKKKPELETIYNDLFYEDFSSQINGNVTDNMKNLMKRLKALPDEERKIILCRYNKNANYQINEKCEFVDEQVRESATQEINVEVEEQSQMKTEQVPETSREKDTNIGKDDESMLEAHFEYMKNHQTEQTSQVVEEYWNENHSQQAKAYEQQQPEKIKPREESIREEIGDKIDKENNMQIQEKKNPEVDVWMNRFNSWYNAIDRVSQNVKAKFVKMKSDIVNAISGKLKEKMNQRQQNTQEQDSNER